MFQSLLDTRVEAVPRSYRSFGIAFGLHAMLFAVIIFGSYLVVGSITPPGVDVPTLWVAIVPPPESGGGDRPAVAPPRKKEPAVDVSKPREPEQPTRIPDPLPSEIAPIVSTPVVGPDEPGAGVDGPGGTGGHGEHGIGVGTGDGTGPGHGDGPPGGTRENGPIFVDATVSKPELLVRVQPRYPETARLARIQGTVLVQAVISSTGEVESVEVVSSTHPIFDAAAKEAVRKWRYRPATQNGRPIAVYFTVEVRFLLQ